MTIKALTGIHPLIFLLIATILEASGDAVVRLGLYNHAGLLRIGLFVGGHCLITGLPGTAKTLLVRTMAEVLGLLFKRIQFKRILFKRILFKHILTDLPFPRHHVRGTVS